MKIFLTLCLLLISWSALALEVPPLRSPVEDKAGVLTADKKSLLEEKIRQIWEQEKQVQISVLIIPSLAGESIEDYSIKVAEKWQLGTKKEGNGLLILIAVQDRKIRIETGNRIEGVITDAKSGRIINDMKSFLKDKDFHGAVNIAVTEINSLMRANTPEALAERVQVEKIEAERRAEQEKVDAEQRDANMALMAQVAVWVLVGLLFLVSAFNLFANYIGIPKEIKSLNEEKEKVTNRINTENANLSEKTNQLQGMKIDRNKHTYLSNQRAHQGLVSRKSQLTASIKTMKSYLGVK